MDDILAALRVEGISSYSHFQGIGDVVSYLKTKQVCNAHVWAKGTAFLPAEDVLLGRRWPMFCHTMHDTVLAPHFFELVLGTFGIAKNYFGEFPGLYSMNAFWTQPAPGQPEYLDTHGWHRDTDNTKQLVLFVYGVDVNQESDGSHVYMRRSHIDGPRNQVIGDKFIDDPELKTNILGPAGTSFLVDTWGFHRANRPQLRERLLLWARWGIDINPISYASDKLSPIPKELLGDRYPSDPELQEAIKLVVS